MKHSVSPQDAGTKKTHLKAEIPGTVIHEYAIAIGKALGHTPEEYAAEEWAHRQAKQMISKKVPLEEMVACAEWMMETDSKWWAKHTVKIATVRDKLLAYRKALKEGWEPGQKGQSNGKRSNSREARDLPPTKGSTTEYYAKDMEYAEEQAKWRKEHGIGVGNTS